MKGFDRWLLLALAVLLAAFLLIPSKEGRPDDRAPYLMNPGDPMAMETQTIVNGKVTQVYDGDTFTFVTWRAHHIRLCGIDAPEIPTEKGLAAARYLRPMLLDNIVSCTPVGRGTPCDGMSDRWSFNRIVAQCFIYDSAGRPFDIASRMVMAGHAIPAPLFSESYYTPANIADRTARGLD